LLTVSHKIEKRHCVKCVTSEEEKKEEEEDEEELKRKKEKRRKCYKCVG
jgi:hypothetical protein